MTQSDSGKPLPWHVTYGGKFQFGDTPRLETLRWHDSIGSGSTIPTYVSAIGELAQEAMTKLIDFGPQRSSVAQMRLRSDSARLVPRATMTRSSVGCIGVEVDMARATPSSRVSSASR